MVPNRLYPLCRLAELYIKMGDYGRFHDMKQKIDSFKSKVESPTTEMLRKRISELSDSIKSDTTKLMDESGSGLIEVE